MIRITERQAELLAPEFAPAEPLTKEQRKSKPEDLFAAQCRQYRLPTPERQLLFAKSIGRRWMFDFAFREYHLAVEIEGLVVNRVNGELIVRGRHASISGFKEDCEKYANAAILGWTVLRFEQSMVKSKFAIEYTMRALAVRGWKSPGESPCTA